MVQKELPSVAFLNQEKMQQSCKRLYTAIRARRACFKGNEIKICHFFLFIFTHNQIKPTAKRRRIIPPTMYIKVLESRMFDFSVKVNSQLFSQDNICYKPLPLQKIVP